MIVHSLTRFGLLALTLSASSAVAQPSSGGWLDEAEDPRFRSELLSYSMELAVHGQDETYVSPLFRVGFSPLDVLTLELQMGFVAAPEVRAGNPMLAVWYSDRIGPANPGHRSFDDVGGGAHQRSSVRTRYGTSYRVGLALTAPLAQASNGAGGGALAGAALQRGNRNAWLWASETFAAAIPAELRSRTENFIVAVDAAFALFAPVGGQGSDVEVMWQAGLDLGGLVARDIFGFGARVDVVHFPANPFDGFQASTEPYLKLSLFDHYLRAGLRMNLDEPGGPPFDPTLPGVPSWSVNVTIGGSLLH